MPGCTDTQTQTSDRIRYPDHKNCR